MPTEQPPKEIKTGKSLESKPALSPMPGSSPCCCKKPVQTPQPSLEAFFNKKFYFLKLAVFALLWGALYSQIVEISKWLTYDLFKLSPSTQTADALEFFIYDSSKILLLLVAMVYVIAWIRVSISVEKVRDFLTGKNRISGYVLGSSFGAVTPFCSCSSIPLFIGFISARIPLGATMAFLITSPLINEVAIVILWGLLGWKFTLVYVAIGMLAGIVGGFVMDYLKAERWLQPFLLKHLNESQSNSETGAATGLAQEKTAQEKTVEKLSIAARHAFAINETKDIFKRVWLWVIIGVGVGAGLHGYVPQEWVAETLGKGQWWSVPVSVLIGIPLYTNVTGIIPIMESLLLKGLPLGTTLALCMSTVAVSLPEILMLKQVIRWQLLSIFILLMLVIFSLVGWFFNATNFAIL